MDRIIRADDKDTDDTTADNADTEAGAVSSLFEAAKGVSP